MLCDSTERPSLGTKAAVYAFLAWLLSSNVHLIPPFSNATAAHLGDITVSFGASVLLSGRPLDGERYNSPLNITTLINDLTL